MSNDKVNKRLHRLEEEFVFEDFFIDTEYDDLSYPEVCDIVCEMYEEAGLTIEDAELFLEGAAVATRPGTTLRNAANNIKKIGGRLTKGVRNAISGNNKRNKKIGGRNRVGRSGSRRANRRTSRGPKTPRTPGRFKSLANPETPKADTKTKTNWTKKALDIGKRVAGTALKTGITRSLPLAGKTAVALATADLQTQSLKHKKGEPAPGSLEHAKKHGGLKPAPTEVDKESDPKPTAPRRVPTRDFGSDYKTKEKQAFDKAAEWEKQKQASAQKNKQGEGQKEKEKQAEAEQQQQKQQQKQATAVATTKNPPAKSNKPSKKPDKKPGKKIPPIPLPRPSLPSISGGSTKALGGHISRARDPNESFEFVCDYLIQEGYAETGPQAEAMYHHMSDQWMEFINEQ